MSALLSQTGMMPRVTPTPTPSARPRPHFGTLNLSVIGCPSALGQPRKGVEEGPNALRESGLLEQLGALGWTVTDKGDLDVNVELPDDDPVDDEGARRPRSCGRANQIISDAVYAERAVGNFCLQLGGDHSIAIGTISGILRADPDACVIWIDAHGDINTPATSESKNIHGMPVAFLCGLGNVRTTPGFDWLDFGCLRPDRIAFIGLRDVDLKEMTVLADAGIAAYSMHEVDKYGIAKVVEMALSRINPDLSRSIHLSFDIDGLDPVHAPSTGTLAAGGLTLREGRYLCEALALTGCLRSMDMVEVNPRLRPEHAHLTVEAAAMMIRAALGKTLL